MWLQTRLRVPAAPSSARGQSLVEFALVLPLLLLLLLGIADFGRIFSAAITTEAAVRNAAEAAALEYLQLDATDGLPNTLTTAQYNALRQTAQRVGCHEAERLPGRVLAGSTCEDLVANPTTMPWFAVCIHDNAAGDVNCGSDSAGAPAACTEMSSGWSATRSGPTDGRPYVEVRLCYRFEPLLGVTLGLWGNVWLQKENNFTVTNY